MPLNFGLVAAGGQILAQDKALPPAMKQAIMKLIENLPKHDSKVSYQIGTDTFHCLIENTILYIVISDTETPTRTAYGALTDVKEAFKEQFAGPGKYPKPADLTTSRCNKFGSTIATKVRYFNDNPQGDKIGKLKNQIEEVRVTMLSNIDMVIQRGADIQQMVDKSETLVEQSEEFQDNATELHRTMLWRHVKIILIGLLILGVLGLIIAMIACKPNFSKCKAKPTPAAPAAPTTTAAPTAPGATTTSTATTAPATTTSTTTTTTTTTPTTTPTTAATTTAAPTST